MLLAKYKGGSHLYGMNTPASDIDEREIFLNTDSAYILGTKRFDQLVKNNEEEDIHNVELRKFFETMRKGNTQSIEVLCAKESSFDFLHPLMVELRANKNKLVDAHKLFYVVSKFIQAQKYLMFDDKREAKEGSKRKEAIDKYGYVPKAASTALRLASSATSFFRRGEYIVEVDEQSMARFVKLNPEKCSPEDIRQMVETFDKTLKDAYENSTIEKSEFDEDYANDFLLRAYFPFLLDRHAQL